MKFQYGNNKNQFHEDKQLRWVQQQAERTRNKRESYAEIVKKSVMQKQEVNKNREGRYKVEKGNQKKLFFTNLEEKASVVEIWKKFK